jgi:hypothetical protein
MAAVRSNGGSQDGENGTDKDKKPGIPEWALKTAGTIIGGLGLAGSMVVIGSAVLWTRFKEAGVPAIQAISVQPRDETLVQGAQTTIVFVLIAVAVVAALYVADGRDLGAEQTGEGGDDEAAEPADPHKMGWRTVAFVCLLPVAGILWASIWPALSFWRVAGLGLVAILLTVGCLWMGHIKSKNFWALAAAVFASVIVFAGLASYLIVKEQKFIQAVAVVRGSDDSGLTGFYVTANADKLYVATPVGPGAGNSGDIAMQKVALSEAATYSVGPLESIPAAERSAQTMLRHLIADREGLSSRQAALPGWIPADKAATFSGRIEAKEAVPDEGLCLMRFAETDQKEKKGSFWTSCTEAEAETTVHDARERFALPSRFQKHYEVRVKVEVPGGTKLRYAEGAVAPQCAGGPGQPCGHRYPGGGLQYWIEDPTKLGEITLECTDSATDQETAWEPCKG